MEVSMRARDDEGELLHAVNSTATDVAVGEDEAAGERNGAEVAAVGDDEEAKVNMGMI